MTTRKLIIGNVICTTCYVFGVVMLAHFARPIQPGDLALVAIAGEAVGVLWGLAIAAAITPEARQ